MKSKERRLQSLLSRTQHSMWYCHEPSREEHWQKLLKENTTPPVLGFRKKHVANLVEIEKLRIELQITVDDLYRMWNKATQLRYKAQNEYKKKPQKEGRDNKGVYVGNGGSNANKVRYPSKKRSKRTWKIFYEMFPYYAQRDGWDGETSKRMKK